MARGNPVGPIFGMNNQSLYAVPISLANQKAMHKRGVIASHNGFKAGQAPVIRNTSLPRMPRKLK